MSKQKQLGIVYAMWIKSTNNIYIGECYEDRFEERQKEETTYVINK